MYLNEIDSSGINHTERQSIDEFEDLGIKIWEHILQNITKLQPQTNK